MAVGSMGSSMAKAFISQQADKEGKENGRKARGSSGWMRILIRQMTIGMTEYIKVLLQHMLIKSIQFYMLI